MKIREITGIQLKMNFRSVSGNRFKEMLDQGIFSVLIELPVPREDAKIDDLLPRYRELLSVIENDSAIPAGFVFVDQDPDHPACNMAEFASKLCEKERDRHVFCIHGRGRKTEDIEAEIGSLVSENFTSLLAVSGWSFPGPGTDHACMESIEILKKASACSTPLFKGCAVNPFKYRMEDSVWQYAKLDKKLSSGAEFVIAQAGWDMRKLQELRWNMFRRNIYAPTLARYEMLTPERAGEIRSGRVPGIFFTRDLASAILRELEGTPSQREAAQLRRLQIHAAGALLLGYTGMQIAGVTTPAQLSGILSRIASCLKDFRTLPEWISAYNDYYARMEMMPYPYRYYFFEKPLDPEVTLDTLLENTSDRLPPCSWSEIKKFEWGKFLLGKADLLPPEERKLTKKLIASCPGGCSKCTLPSTAYVCIQRCPKHLAGGPCGDTSVDGKCVFTGKECIHSSRIRREAAAGRGVVSPEQNPQ